MDIKTILVVFVLGLIMCSCSADEPKYSCDKEVNEWVKDHISDIHLMSRADWLEADEELSLPMYRAFTQEQRVKFWREKFQELKNLPWSEGELSHIKIAEDYFENHLSLFGSEPPSEAQLDDVEIFCYKWSEKGRDKFNWSDQIIYSIIASGDLVIDTEGTLYSRGFSAGGVLSASSETLSCNCHIKSMFTCTQYVSCEAVTCEGTSVGCGGFLLWECDGRCEEPEYQ